jgi:hypothetical protein
MIFRTLPALLAALALLAGCAGKSQPTPSALPSAPVALPQARAALEQGQYEVAVALAGPWAATSPEAAQLVAEAHLARAEAALRGAPDSAAARQRNSLNELALAISIAPKGGLRDRIAARMADLAHATEPTAAEPTAAAHAPSLVPASPAPRPQSAPPTPLPQPARPAYVVAERKSFEGSGESGRFESCVDVQVIAQSGPVAGAVVAVNNGDHSYQSQTDADGYTGRCGLGPSTWSVVLFWTPGGGDSGVATTVYLSGAPEQRAAVTFEER